MADHVWRIEAIAGQYSLDSWTGLTDAQLTQHLVKEKVLSVQDAEDAIQLSREWATTITGSSVFAVSRKPH